MDDFPRADGKEKSERYKLQVDFINTATTLKAQQFNFTVGMRRQLLLQMEPPPSQVFRIPDIFGEDTEAHDKLGQHMRRKCGPPHQDAMRRPWFINPAIKLFARGLKLRAALGATVFQLLLATTEDPAEQHVLYACLIWTRILRLERHHRRPRLVSHLRGREVHADTELLCVARAQDRAIARNADYAGQGAAVEEPLLVDALSASLPSELLLLERIDGSPILVENFVHRNNLQPRVSGEADIDGGRQESGQGPRAPVLTVRHRSAHPGRVRRREVMQAC